MNLDFTHFPFPRHRGLWVTVPVLLVASLAFVLVSCTGCVTDEIQPPPGTKRVKIEVETTGYDSGPISCGWKRNWYGRPVYAYGPNKGKPKVVGQTASGTMASPGTLAADTRYYPFGTVFYIQGYGYGVVEDRGGAIKGPARLDLWFSSREEALQWGRKKVPAFVWLTDEQIRKTKLPPPPPAKKPTPVRPQKKRK